MHRDRRQVQQYDQDKENGLSLLGYAMWKLDTKLVAWVNLDVGIHLDLSSVSSYPS